MSNNDTANGAASGAAMGTSVLPGWGTAIGAVLGGVGGYLSGRSKKKAAKKQQQMLQEALNQFRSGAVDALGNKLSADSTGKWTFNPGLAGKNAALAATRANILAGTTPLKSRSEIARDNFNANHIGNMLAARANQAAAMRSGMRTNSNIGNISQALARQTANNFTQNYANALQNAKNDAVYNANIASNLGVAAQNASAPINNMQNNLTQQVATLNPIAMQQYNTMTSAQNPYTNGQGTADLFKGLGGMLSAFSQNQQEQNNYDALLNAIMQRNNTNSNKYLPLLLQNPNYIKLGAK